MRKCGNNFKTKYSPAKFGASVFVSGLWNFTQ
jgi:hypothetical protein